MDMIGNEDLDYETSHTEEQIKIPEEQIPETTSPDHPEKAWHHGMGHSYVPGETPWSISLEPRARPC